MVEPLRLEAVDELAVLDELVVEGIEPNLEMALDMEDDTLVVEALVLDDVKLLVKNELDLEEELAVCGSIFVGSKSLSNIVGRSINFLITI